MKRYDRRKFLGTASCGAVGTATVFSSLFNLGMANVMAGTRSKSFGNAIGEDYKALVCILLAGGNDSYNMLIPYDEDPFRDYQATRSELTLPRASVLPLNGLDDLGRNFALHPAMPELQGLYHAGKAAFVANVGTLVQPVTREQVFNQSVQLPLGLLSHSDQAQHWQTSIPQSRSASGWGGRIADIMQELNSNKELSMNISLAGNNAFQVGDQSVAYSILPYGGGSIGITGFEEEDPFFALQQSAVKSLLEQQYQDVFKQTYAEVINRGQTNHELFSGAVRSVTLNTIFSATEVSEQFQMIARVIGARQALGMRRQTFFLTFGGWDHHDELLNNQAEMLGILSKGLSEFQAALGELGVEECVTTFTISDFARTLTSNGNGTDHAWGGNCIVQGGAVQGGKVYGTYPDLALNSELDLGGGILVPTTSCDEYFAELSLWFDVPRSDLGVIFPNLGNFYSTSGNENPIGFMGE
ncbi:MAG: DUF1501 domain-containing protein [Bacteroidota bacterium]